MGSNGQTKLSDYIFDFLSSNGIKQAFMLPGGGAMHLVDSLGSSRIPYVCFFHEQAATIAAEAYAQHSNTPGLVVVTSGPGATNTITGIAAAWIDSTPMVVITGQAKRSDLIGEKGVRQSGSQEVEIVKIASPITKYCVQVLNPEKIKYHLERALYESCSGRRGPVLLDIPLDVQAQYIDASRLEGYCCQKTITEDISGVIRAAVHLIKKAEKPVFLVGNGVETSGATPLLQTLAEKYSIPVLTTWKAIDSFSEDNPVYIGHPGVMGDRGANIILQNADLLLSIGSRLDPSITAYNEDDFARNAKKIIVDIDKNELNRMKIPAEIKLECDAKVFLAQLLAAFKGNDGVSYQDWLEQCHGIRDSFPVCALRNKASSREAISNYSFIESLCLFLSEDDIIVPESAGAAGEITYQAFKLKNGQKMKNAAGLGSMGFGLPYAIGSSLANNGRRTILINGDGAFQLNIQELGTLHRLQLPVKIFILCNGGYASIRAMQRNNFDGRLVASSSESGSSMPDIGRIASAYGLKTFQIHRDYELSDTIPKVLRTNGPTLCEVFVDPDETVSPRVKTIVNANGSIQSTPLDRMWPFLEQGDTSREVR